MPVQPAGRVAGPLLLLLLCALHASVIRTPLLSAQMHDERLVRAAFVYNLTKYVSWPRSGNELVIGVIGEGSMGSLLARRLSGKTTDTRTIRVILAPSRQELHRCDIFYYAGESSDSRPAILTLARENSILTVGETAAFARQGGMIGLVRAGDQIQIHVNLEAVQEAKLKISAQLLNLSTIERTGKGVKD